MQPTTLKNDKTTALQLWNRKLRTNLQGALFTKGKKNVTIPMKTAVERTECAIHLAEQFEVTKHRIIVDGLIKQLELTDKLIVDLYEKIHDTYWLRFAKHRRLQMEYTLAISVRTTYQQALMIVVNTPPPFVPDPSMN